MASCLAGHLPGSLVRGQLGLLVFIFVHAIAFTWAFDSVVGLPASAVRNSPGSE
jgi:uncharacterized membrane protein